MEDGCKAVADSSRVRAVLKADDECEKLNVSDRIAYLSSLAEDPSDFLGSENCITRTSKSFEWIKQCADAELQVAKASQNKNITFEELILQRARSWAYAMLVFLYEPLQIAVTKEVLESTALRGLALAIMDDAEDARKDAEKGEHTVFTLFPDVAANRCLSILAAILEYQSEPNPMFEFLEKSAIGQGLLSVLCSAAAIRCLQFKDRCTEDAKGIFDVRKFLMALC
jgi:hypothetical protein